MSDPFEASGPAYGIESSFCKAAMARSGMRSLRKEATKLKREAETEMEGSGSFIDVRVGINAVIQTNGADR